MNDRTDVLHPDFEPGEFDRTERELRQALTMEAHRMNPTDRLDDVLRTAREAGPATGGGSSRRWLVPVAAAASVALIAGGAWVATHRGSDQLVPTPPASSGPVDTSATGSATSGTTAPTTQPTTLPPVAGAGTTLPVYFVGPIGDSKPTYKLFREFVRAGLPQGATDAARAKAALVQAINAQPYSNTDGYLQPWSGQTIGAVTVTDQKISVALANSGPSGFDAETQRLAVQELVWTAQAAVGKGTIPVQFTVADGSSALFGRFPTAQTYSRPGTDQLWKDLAPIWVTAPARDQVLPAAKPVVVQGQAIVFEATVSWDLKRGSSTVKTGHTMASVGAPSQGSYSVNLGVLTPGDYTIRAYEVSMADGSVAAEKSVTFTVK